MLSKSLSNPKAWILLLQELTNLFHIDSNMLIVMVPILINKDVFELSHNDLKFTVQNHNLENAITFFFLPTLINIRSPDFA